MSASSQLEHGAGFVAGTVVHTKNGLVPIEQIRVGDWVLSKPESGEGENGYKRVLKADEYDEKEVYFVMYSTLSSECHREYGHVVVAGKYRFWIPHLENDEEVRGLFDWVSASEIDKLNDETMLHPMFGLQDGRLARFEYSGPLLRTARSEIGLVFYDPIREFITDPNGVAVEFLTGRSEFSRDERGHLRKIYLDIDRDYVQCDPNSDSIYYRTSGCHPLLRKVYNFEVEDFHTYFVDVFGVWVHDFAGEER